MPSGKQRLRGIVACPIKVPYTVRLRTLEDPGNCRIDYHTDGAIEIIGTHRARMRRAIGMYVAAKAGGAMPTRTEQDDIIQKVQTATQNYLEARDQGLKTIANWRHRLLDALAITDTVSIRELKRRARVERAARAKGKALPKFKDPDPGAINKRLMVLTFMQRELLPLGCDLFAIKSFLQYDAKWTASDRPDVFEAIRPMFETLAQWDAKSSADSPMDKLATKGTARDPLLAELIHDLAPIWQHYTNRGLRRASTADGGNKRNFFAIWVIGLLQRCGVTKVPVSGAIDTIVDDWEKSGFPKSMWDQTDSTAVQSK